MKSYKIVGTKINEVLSIKQQEIRCVERLSDNVKFFVGEEVVGKSFGCDVLIFKIHSFYEVGEQCFALTGNAVHPFFKLSNLKHTVSGYKTEQDIITGEVRKVTRMCDNITFSIDDAIQVDDKTCLSGTNITTIKRFIIDLDCCWIVPGNRDWTYYALSAIQPYSPPTYLINSYFWKINGQVRNLGKIRTIERIKDNIKFSVDDIVTHKGEQYKIESFDEVDKTTVRIFLRPIDRALQPQAFASLTVWDINSIEKYCPQRGLINRNGIADSMEMIQKADILISIQHNPVSGSVMATAIKNRYGKEGTLSHTELWELIKPKPTYHCGIDPINTKLSPEIESYLLYNDSVMSSRYLYEIGDEITFKREDAVTILPGRGERPTVGIITAINAVTFSWGTDVIFTVKNKGWKLEVLTKSRTVQPLKCIRKGKEILCWESYDRGPNYNGGMK